MILNSLKSNHAFSQLKRCESKLSTYVALKQQGPLFDEASNYVGDVCNVTVWRLSYVGNAKRQCVCLRLPNMVGVICKFASVVATPGQRSGYRPMGG